MEIMEKHQFIDKAVESLEANLVVFEPNSKSFGFNELIADLVSLFQMRCT